MTSIELDLKINVEAFTAEQRRAAARGLHKATRHVLTASNQRVPFETGDLERSGRPVVDEVNLRGVISYDQPYAVAQHEELGYRHERGQAKYLESALREEADTVRELIAAELRRALR
ncbi:hypothetical protein Ppa06_58240 [Planomonospora parontospora subsp. parontospora]|uniref:HK97 gp10 family phage protein n=3 Tax=Planomonospora TaxID=1998 RepID=A0AA37F774_9ACTN|nr:hypothetical protein [Planomonospora parontospora]GGK90225.1 hypothetical protein GCM10010126_57070 [Planomonospora parontospora]GII12026.1 hypothetical protein Ppa06_58240 [Planomonospora parontospora subsp. parontospora]